MRIGIAITMLALASSISAAHADPVMLGAHYYANASLTSTASVVIAPSANVSGAIITTLELYNDGGSVSVAANYPDSTTRYILQSSTVTGAAGSFLNTRLPYPIALPPGVGLSIVANSTTQAGAYVTYDIKN